MSKYQELQIPDDQFDNVKEFLKRGTRYVGYTIADAFGDRVVYVLNSFFEHKHNIPGCTLLGSGYNVSSVLMLNGFGDEGIEIEEKREQQEIQALGIAVEDLTPGQTIMSDGHGCFNAVSVNTLKLQHDKVLVPLDTTIDLPYVKFINVHSKHEVASHELGLVCLREFGETCKVCDAGHSPEDSYTKVYYHASVLFVDGSYAEVSLAVPLSLSKQPLYNGLDISLTTKRPTLNPGKAGSVTNLPRNDSQLESQFDYTKEQLLAVHRPVFRMQADNASANLLARLSTSINMSGAITGRVGSTGAPSSSGRPRVLEKELKSNPVTIIPDGEDLGDVSTLSFKHSKQNNVLNRSAFTGKSITVQDRDCFYYKVPIHNLTKAVSVLDRMSTCENGGIYVTMAVGHDDNMWFKFHSPAPELGLLSDLIYDGSRGIISKDRTGTYFYATRFDLIPDKLKNSRLPRLTNIEIQELKEL